MYTFESRVRYSETDSEGKLTMASLINYFQDCSTFQSEDLGMGLEYLRQRHLVWALSSWQIVVDRYPKLGERVITGTLPYEIKGFVGYRNFFMKEESGAYLARANSLWSLLNTETGRPTAALPEMIRGYERGEKLDMEYAPRRIAIPPEGVIREALVVKKHHLDTNYHVNNQQFIDMAMDYLPDDFRVGQVRAEYKKQAFLNDVLTPRVTQEGDRVVIVLGDGDGKPYVTTEFLRRADV